MFNRITSFSPVLVSAVHKSTVPTLWADAVATAAEKYASNAGAKNLISPIIAACTTTDKGKARTPAAGTVAALVHSAMSLILATAESAGARPGQGTDTERTERAAAFAESVRASYVASVETAALARKAAAETRKAAMPPIAADGTGKDGANIDTTNPAFLAANLPASIALAALASVESIEFGAAMRASPIQAEALRNLLASFDDAETLRAEALRAEALRASSIPAQPAETTIPAQPPEESGAAFNDARKGRKGRKGSLTISDTSALPA